MATAILTTYSEQARIYTEYINFCFLNRVYNWGKRGKEIFDAARALLKTKHSWKSLL